MRFNKYRMRAKLGRHRQIIDFNKEILTGEIGALLCAPLFGFIGSVIIRNPTFIAFFTLFGSVIGGSIFWASMRIYDQKKRNEFSLKRFTKGISFYTPVAFLISLLAAYPTVFFVTRSISNSHLHIYFLSSLAGELSGFIVFLILINCYRYVLEHHFNKIL